MKQLPEPPQGLTKQADDEMTAVFDALVLAQNTHITEDVAEEIVNEFDGTTTTIRKRKSYLQLAVSHNVPPKDGTAAAPDRLENKLNGEDKSWGDLGIIPASSLLSYRTDVYDGPSGKGWTLTGFIKVGGETFFRVINYGEEVWRDTGGWSKMTMEEN